MRRKPLHCLHCWATAVLLMDAARHQRSGRRSQQNKKWNHGDATDGQRIVSANTKSSSDALRPPHSCSGLYDGLGLDRRRSAKVIGQISGSAARWPESYFKDEMQPGRPLSSGSVFFLSEGLFAVYWLCFLTPGSEWGWGEWGGGGGA